ncbi:hypothetical protein CTAYLR_006873 [Chrysophaeum taylorii]|uniref:Glucokinase n=1 Tax=Chrysophaeum taylorii TaxID=2483200 RepID=A0AAD7U555_9STRA|nr:hypothetical protein CTAYLR_006873 [Chrysophaeum taylorii]
MADEEVVKQQRSGRGIDHARTAEIEDHLQPPPPVSPKRTGSMLEHVTCVVCGDLGGTNSRLELFRIDDPARASELDLAKVGRETPFFKNTYKNDKVDGDFTTLLHQFLKDCRLTHLELVAGCLAVAGPVSNDRVHFTNLSWIVDSRQLEQEFLMPHGSMRLINDFVANGYGVVTLADHEYDDISPRGKVDATRGAPVACVGAGTGLGETFATCVPGTEPVSGVLRYDAWPSEGGHVGFAPRDPIQRELLEHLHDKFGGRVSTERVVSGKGIVNVYEFLASKFPEDVDPIIDKRIRTETEGAAIVSRSAYDNKLCERAMEIVLDAYGAELGNAAIKWLPFGGLYVAGGIAGKNLERIRAEGSAFYKAYLDRGRVKTVLDRIPLRLVTVDDLGLRGAHYVAITILIEFAKNKKPALRLETSSPDDYPEPDDSDWEAKNDASDAKIQQSLEPARIDGSSSLETALLGVARAMVFCSVGISLTALFCTALLTRRSI